MAHPHHGGSPSCDHIYKKYLHSNTETRETVIKSPDCTAQPSEYWGEPSCLSASGSDKGPRLSSLVLLSYPGQHYRTVSTTKWQMEYRSLRQLCYQRNSDFFCFLCWAAQGIQMVVPSMTSHLASPCSGSWILITSHSGFLEFLSVWAVSFPALQPRGPGHTGLSQVQEDLPWTCGQTLTQMTQLVFLADSDRVPVAMAWPRWVGRGVGKEMVCLNRV